MANTANQNKQKDPKERSFHDAWAFYIYLGVAIVLNTFYFLNAGDIPKELGDYFSTYKIAQVVFSNLALAICLLMLSLLCCYFIPKVLIILSVLAVPIISISLFFYNGLDKNEFAGIIGIAIFIINLIFLVLAGFVIFANLDYIAHAMSIGAGIYFSNFLSILLMQIISFFVLILIMTPVFLADSKNDAVNMSRYLAIFLFVWTITITKIFMEVFISSVVLYHLKAPEDGIFSNALNNSTYALGSVSYAALLIAIISSLETMIQEARADQYHRDVSRSRSAAMSLAIAESLLSILGDVVKFANNIAFPYLAINGTGYSESVAQSFQLLVSSNLEKIAAYHGINFVVFLVTLLNSVALFFFNKLFIFEVLVGGKSSDLAYLAITLSAFIAFFYIMFSLLRSAVMALIYAAAAFNKELKDYSPEFIDLLEEEKKKNVPHDVAAKSEQVK